jgi:DNA primase
MADFAAIKERVTIEQAAQSLGLKLTPSGAQQRGACPACGTGGPRALVITPAKQLFYCFSAGIGGDLIAMWGHVQKCSLSDAGRHIADTFGIGTVTSGTRAPVASVNSSAAPPSERGQLKPLDYLEPDHPAVEAAGFDAETAQALGIGHAAKGIMRGTVAVPIRDDTGTLLGYIGVTEARLPPKGLIGTNVVRFPKTA